MVLHAARTGAGGRRLRPPAHGRRARARALRPAGGPAAHPREGGLGNARPDQSFPQERLAMALFRGMDRAALDAAYNNRNAVADYPRIAAERVKRSEKVRAARKFHADLKYGRG